MFYLHICIDGDVAGTTQSQTAPFVPRLTDKIRLEEFRFRVIEVEIEYTPHGTEIYVHLERL